MSVVVENKTFILELYRGAREAQAATIIEKGRGRAFRANTTEGGARWMGRLLCECSVTSCKSDRYQDLRVSIVGAVRNNRKGSYLEFQCFEKGSKNFNRILCFPAGVDKEGWAKAGSTFLSLLDRDLEKGCSRRKEMESQREGKE
ncbi:hypothetical protein FRX31_010352, partial [Thalictrum thalictroides]